ncbi:MAG: ATP synthase F1 subunit delta [Sphaerobacter sp.]|nr:ATP synthase F1 subunit delta [Sphaerobacter sp.]
MAAAGAARRYAQAAFEIAREQGALDQWERDLQRLSEVLADPTVEAFFASPAVPEEAKREAIATLLPEEPQRLVRNLVLLLLERGRLPQLPQVAEEFSHLVLQERGIAIAEVTTAVPLSEDEQRLVGERVAALIGKQVELRPRVDPDIIGGLVVRVEDNLIDGSVRAQLHQLRQRMVS